ncbi:uncharacterized protein EV422DRAFT_400906 [Fimicolochytrium jonesii]|uniref:uncharacterized protein n=1 Tax=Fimicolochytrium jonesii TaxID=1396493 RepID=UPI0022FDCB42|nr:uncharacterized protein EV422DRAFT_400906 [Fimicolochytrium jonesii]KAI8822497.1 hypothetical protein EV422DRAFT_400906 [Fimicolochytrium jonesii]
MPKVFLHLLPLRRRRLHVLQFTALRNSLGIMTGVPDHPRILYIHGRVSSKTTPKLQHLSTRYHTHCVEYTPEQAQDYGWVVRQQAQAIRDFQPDVVVGSSYGGSVAITLCQRGYDALTAKSGDDGGKRAARVLVAGRRNSVLESDKNAELVGWVGPTILLAQAHVRKFGALDDAHREANVWWPAEVPADMFHGTKDDVIPVEDTKLLAHSLKSKIKLRIKSPVMGFIEFKELPGEEHRLESLASGDQLFQAVARVTERWEHGRSLIPEPVSP